MSTNNVHPASCPIAFQYPSNFQINIFSKPFSATVIKYSRLIRNIPNENFITDLITAEVSIKGLGLEEGRQLMSIVQV